jgi:branched-subunit amino acid transport protein AzlD
MLSSGQAVIYAFAMAAVIYFCRAFPFLFFRDNRKGGAGTEAFLSLVEKAAPPVAMTVLTFNAISGSIKEDAGTALPALIASAFTALIHLWKRNALLSILGGTALYMVLTRILMR